MLVGAKPRTADIERADLLKDNGKIFIETGKAIDENASANCKGVMVGNPANTNCLILSRMLTRIPKTNFGAMTRLDHNRALGQISLKSGVPVTKISNMCIWGNHSPTM